MTMKQTIKVSNREGVRLSMTKILNAIIDNEGECLVMGIEDNERIRLVCPNVSAAFIRECIECLDELHEDMIKKGTH